MPAKTVKSAYAVAQPKQRNQFSVNNACEMRPAWEMLGRRIAMAIEQRQLTVARELIEAAEHAAGCVDGVIGATVGGGSKDVDLSMPLALIGMDIRLVNALESIRVYRLADLLQCHKQRILKIPSVGRKSMEQIKAALENLGFKVPGDFLE